VQVAEVPSLRAVVQPDGQRDKGLRRQSATEHTPLPDEGVVQRVVPKPQSIVSIYSHHARLGQLKL